MEAPQSSFSTQPTFSPLSSPPGSQPVFQGIKRGHVQRQYRPAIPFPFELAQHIQIYFEEDLFTQAFDFIIKNALARAASPDPTSPALLPSNLHLAIAATISIHPVFTSKTALKDKWQQSSLALRLLRLTNNITGPINSDFYNALAFRKYDSRSSRNGGRKVKSDEEESPDQIEKINTPYASSECVYTRAEDFWHIVGWALNCSCLEGMYLVRWQYWSTWLETMLQIFQDEWEIRFHEQKTEESLIWNYVDLASGGHGKHRRILRAILADGSAKSLNEFKEVFRHELKEPAKDADKLKKLEVNVNVQEEIYGDYMTREEDDLSDEDVKVEPSTRRKSSRSRTPSSRRVTPRNSNSSLRSSYSAMDTDADNPAVASLGPPQSLTIRLRLLHLLSHLAGSIPEFFLEIRELYTLFVEFIRPLPLPVFQQLISPSVQPNSALSPDAHTTLCELLLQRMLESAAPIETSEKFLTQDKLVMNYMPWAASRGDAESNARVSLLVEALVRRMAAAGNLRKTGPLTEALDVGVTRRTRKVGEGSGRKKKKDRDPDVEEIAWAWLLGSGERMRAVVQSLS